ncbi:MAG: DUF2135 domain-containing protein [Endomicrobia bacterium]|nr:DUF2135 domain-containing protein [Endomicrobiia bacterium]MCL2507195.1 DUF2135 domain-containing protein [Endomicrobiia bacterium]
MKKFFACLIAVMMFAGSVQSREIVVRPMPMPRPVPMPQMIVSPDRKPITLQDLKIDVEIIGNLAMTTYEMVFHNPNQAIMEGEFVLPLAENQNVSAIALDINGKMRDGVVVEKQKARQTFESIVRRGVDPALVEKTSGNQFKTRIYPFNPDGTRRIRVTIEEPLVTKNDSYYYSLPLSFKQNVNFSINMELPVNSVEVKQKDFKEMPFKFEKTSTVLRASFAKNDYLLDNYISFQIPREKEYVIFTHKDGSETYFYTDINIKASSKDKKLPKKIAVVWDSSLSSSKRDIQREIALLDAYIKKLSNVEVTFVTFNIKTDINKNFTVKNGNWNALKQEIENLIYDGATRFDKLELNNLKTDEILLFSDGVSTLGDTRIEESGTPVFVINSSTEFNRGGLVNASVKSGGSFINLNGNSDEEALMFLTEQNLKLIACEYDKNKFRDVYPKPGIDVGENFTFAGILTAGESEIILSFGYGKKDIAFTKKIKVKAGGDNPAVARLWAVQKIKDLEMDSERNEKEILKLGLEYSVVTDFTSLLVLEFVQDYVTYGIVPPQELLSEYNRILANTRKGEEQNEKSALDDSILQAREIKEWWKKEFDQSKPPKTFEKLKNSDGARIVEERRMLNVADVSRESFDSAKMERVRAVPQAASGNMKATRAVAFRANAEMADMEIQETGRDEAQLVSSSSIQVKAWDPQTPYMKILKKSKDEDIYKDYLKLKSGYDDQPSFYFDVTDEFIRRKMNDKAIVILSNIAEMKLDNVELLRTAANKLMEIGEYQYAVDMFEKILKLRGEDPQSYRDLALAYQANKEYQKSLDTFYKVMERRWNRFNSIKQIVFVEMNNLIALAPKLDTSKINKELIFVMPVDIRVVLGWSTDNTDIDLHVTDPHGEKAFYGNRLTRIGGRVSQDIRDGFGPEEFMIRKAVNGKYEISTNNFGDRRQSVSGPTVLYLDIFMFYGTKKQTHQRILVRTENVKENNIIGTVEFGITH